MFDCDQLNESKILYKRFSCQNSLKTHRNKIGKKKSKKNTFNIRNRRQIKYKAKYTRIYDAKDANMQHDFKNNTFG